MTYDTIATVIIDTERDNMALHAAADLAARLDAHLDVICLGIDRTQPGFYYAGTAAMALQENLVEAERMAAKAEDFAKSKLDEYDGNLRWATVSVSAQLAGVSPFLSQRLRFADLVVLAKPYGAGRAPEAEQIAEAVLFGGHVPILVVPDGSNLSTEPSKAVIAWNESAQALRAIRTALPMLRGAGSVNIAVIDPPQHGPERSDPGGELSQMLARKGVRPEVSVLAKTMPRISDVLMRHLDDQNADLLVMGAYSHSRFREAIFGGTTRSMLEQADIPVFMAH